MNLGNQSQIITDLVTADLKHCKLLYDRARIRISTEGYETRLCNVILHLAGINYKDQTMELCDLYYRETEKIYEINIFDIHGIEKLATEIVQMVMSWNKENLNSSADATEID